VSCIGDALDPKSKLAPGPNLDLAGSSIVDTGRRKGDQVKKAVVGFNWKSLLDETHTNFLAIHSVLTKCGHEYDGTTLTIYTNSKFYKTKLDDTKHRINLIKALETIGAGNVTIETNPAPAPLKDSQAAAVAAIMGGGEEVTVESDAS